MPQGKKVHLGVMLGDPTQDFLQDLVNLPRELGMQDEEQDAQVDRTHFVLPDEQWRVFTEMLDWPARSIPELERLLKGTSILERRRQPINEPDGLQ